MKILKYQIVCYSNIYNEDKMDVESVPILSDVVVEYPTDEDIETAKEIAYNGEYSIEDVEQPEEPAVASKMWDELDAAYTEGVNGAYDQ